MKAMKDKRKFGGASPVSKNRNCKKFGYSYDKEVRKFKQHGAIHILIALC